jgi:2-polyprenyl-3-methyl-5-hydroxy-6-metoxy-1,4-benzoquinol methylase
MKYIESEKIKNNPELYNGIEKAVSWCLKEDYVYDFLKRLDKDANVLDIGCGNGFFLDQLKDLGFYNLFGADIANYLANKEINHKIFDLNVEKMSYEDCSFDVVTAFQALEHLENYFLVLQEIKRILKPGGYFIFSVPNPFSIFSKIKFLFTGNINGWNLKNNHLLFLTKDVFAKTMLNDFYLIQIRYSKGSLPYLNKIKRIPLKFRKEVLPRIEFFGDCVCYILRKK